MEEIIPPDETIHLRGWAENVSLEARIDRLHNIADLMDSRFTIPGTTIRFGLDPVLGLFPGIGDTLSFFVSAWLVKEAEALGVTPAIKYRMIGNILLDLVVGSIPVLGDILDVGFKANQRNLALVREHFGYRR